MADSASQYATDQEVAGLLKVTRTTLETWRRRRSGPPFVRISRRCVRYSLADLALWLDQYKELADVEANKPS